MNNPTPDLTLNKSAVFRETLPAPADYRLSPAGAAALYLLVYVAFGYKELYWGSLFLLEAGQGRHALENLALFFLFSPLLVAALYFAGRPLFGFILLLLCSSFICDQTYYRISGGGLNVDSFGWLIEETHRFADFLAQYYLTLLRSLLIAALFAGMLYAIKANTRPRPKQRLAVSALLLLILLQAAALVSGQFPRYSPISFDKLPILALLHFSLVKDLPHAREDIQTVGKSHFRKIIVVIDESISHEVFQSHQDELFKQLRVHKSLSVSNCSAGSNALIRWGANPRKIVGGHDPRANPTIWQYAAAAGFETYFIDAQADKKRLQNHMSEQEFRMLDNALFVEDGIDTDGKVADTLVDLLNRDTPLFIYANLRGAHFPYYDFPGSHESNLSARERHARSFLYSKNDFFRKVIPALGDDTLFIYTSDHGQVFDRAGTHCNVRNYSRLEYEVPLLVYPESALAGPGKEPTFSNYQIFPSVLQAMGFSRADITARYGDGLGATVCEHHLFQQSIFNSVLGAPPVSEVVRINGCTAGEPTRSIPVATRHSRSP